MAYHSKNHKHTMSRSEAGRRGAEARWGRDYEDDRSSSGRGSRSRYEEDYPMSRSEAGRRGAEARWGKDDNDERDGYGRVYQRGQYQEDYNESLRSRPSRCRSALETRL